MKLTKEEYHALAEIVGPEYITQEPVILDTYNQVWGNKFFFDEKHSIRPAAVLLPANTEEISAVVKVCNKYGILFKAFSSGFEYLSLALVKAKGILLDLKRMNRVLEIDAKNMRAVVEPYVSVYRLQLEAAKHGLYTGRIGVGYSAGVIAASCCHHGCQHTMVFTSGYGRNVLGVEWVLPTGEVLRMGTGESGGDLFSADGPGFSLRGILRGRTGANGGHGVITKASVKLYPWYGPLEWEQKKEPGEPLCHGQLDSVPDGYKVFVPTFKSINDVLEAAADFCRAEILYALGIGILGTAVQSEGNDEEWAMMQKAGPEMPKLFTQSVILVIAGQSPGELEYRENTWLRELNLNRVCIRGGYAFKKGEPSRYRAWLGKSTPSHKPMIVMLYVISGKFPAIYRRLVLPVNPFTDMEYHSLRVRHIPAFRQMTFVVFYRNIVCVEGPYLPV